MKVEPKAQKIKRYIPGQYSKTIEQRTNVKNEKNTQNNMSKEEEISLKHGLENKERPGIDFENLDSFFIKLTNKVPLKVKNTNLTNDVNQTLMNNLLNLNKRNKKIVKIDTISEIITSSTSREEEKKECNY
jgi:hypothetical protein